MSNKVIIYGKEGCPYTDKARAAYKDHIYVDVIAEFGKLDEMLKLSEGTRKVPVIVEDGEVTVGYFGS